MKKSLFLILAAAASMALAQPDPYPEPERRPPTWDDMGITQPPPAEGPEAHGPGRGDRPVQQFLDMLRERNPEEFERLRKLREENPEAFRAELRQKLDRERERRGMRGEPGEGPRWQRGPGEPNEPRGRPREGRPGPDADGMHVRSPEIDRLELKARELAHAYRAATNEGEKNEMRDALKAALQESFDLREKIRRERFAQMEQRVNRIRTMLDERQARRDAIIDRRLKELTESDALAW